MKILALLALSIFIAGCPGKDGGGISSAVQSVTGPTPKSAPKKAAVVIPPRTDSCQLRMENTLNGNLESADCAEAYPR